jgi:hypothetical protein
MLDDVVVEAGREGADAPPPGAVVVEPKGKSALDDALIKTQAVFGGHPSTAADLVEEDEEHGKDAGEEDGLLTQPPKDGKKPDKSAKPRGKTLEEEAELRAEAERWGHELGKEVKDLKTENAGLVARLEALEKKGQGEEPPTPPKKAGEEAPGPVAAAKERIRELLVQIDELDQFDPDYYERKADLMAQLYGKGGNNVSEGDLEKLVAKAVKDQKAKDEEIRTEEDRGQAAAKKVVALAKKLGLDMREAISKDDDGTPTNSYDWDTFWDVSARAPKDLPLDEQVKWCAKEVKRLKTVARQAVIKETEDAAAHHRDTGFLERHGEGRSPAETRKAPTQNLTLQDALVRNRRVV